MSDTTANSATVTAPETATPALELLRSRRFAPLFTGLCIGAFGDNLFRTALVVLVQFKLAALHGFDAAPWVALAPGVFMLPYFLFSATAGQVADKADKAVMMQRLKLIEIFLMALAGLTLIMGSLPLMLGMLFLAGLQSAFYSPLKYAILPQYLGQRDLLSGNAFAGAGVFLSILLGTIAGGAMILWPWGEWIVALALVSISVVGWLSSLFLLPAPASDAGLRINPNPLFETTRMLRTAFAQENLVLVLIGHACFWLVATLVVGQMPTLAEDILNGTQGLFTFLFTLFSVGVGAGALVVRKLLKGRVDGRYVGIGALGLALSLLSLSVLLGNYVPATTEPQDVLNFLSHADGVLIAGLFLLLAMFGGIYIVPLNALLQHRALPELRARTIAASNLLDAGAMVGASVLAALLLKIGFGVSMLWALTALALFFCLPLMMTLAPQVVLKQFAQRLLRTLFDVKVEGLEHLEAAGPKAVIVANHVSLLDGLLLAAFLPGKPLFAVNSFIAERWWVKPFLTMVEAFTIDPTKPMGMKGLIQRVSAGAHCVIFPEGRITTTGSLMKVNEGPGLIADKAQAPIVPIRISGAEYTRLSYLEGVVKRRSFPRIRLTIMPAQSLALPAHLTARQRRHLASQKLYDLMSNLIFETSFHQETLVEALLDAARLHGKNRLVLEDKDRKPISYNRLLLGMTALAPRLERLTQRHEKVGVMLPGSLGVVATFFALQLIGRVPAMINFTSGATNILACCRAAEVTTILTSRQFITLARLDALVEALQAQVNIVYLEDVRVQLGPLSKLWALLKRPFIAQLHARYQVRADEPAVVLFTSGSEGTPKGVVLSHANLVANRWQVGSRLDFSPKDVVLNALPTFHAFGLTGGLIVPLLAGARTLLYPSPLHYRIIPLLAYDCNATILFGTDTFLTGYARTAHPYDFFNLRFVCAGAEKVREETRRLYADRFGVRILEGYGATETAPVISLNTLMHSKQGTVGRLLPGMTAKLTPVPGIEDGGLLHVAGPNIMMGYLKADQPGQLIPPERDGRSLWHNTGDIVTIDADGYITIKGRAKRFAKIAGEMVSLTQVEELASQLWPTAQHATLAIPDERKGEQVILITTQADPQLSDLKAHIKTAGQSELLSPRQIITLAALPVLGTGKTDYVTLAKQLPDLLAASQASKEV